MPSLVFGVAATLLAFPNLQAAEMPPFEWNDGDRVVLIGDTMIERDQKTGYLETLITSQHPGKSITFQNLGWSGDTVLGLSRARFGPPSEGFQHLKDHVLALKPTVLIIGYGMAESFDGDGGLTSFVNGLATLLDALAETKARVILLSPIAHEDVGRPLPNPAEHNLSLAKVRDAVKAAAETRKAWFVDLYQASLSAKDDGMFLTDNGIHLTPLGQWFMDSTIALELEKLKRDSPRWDVRIDLASRQAQGSHTKVSKFESTKRGFKFEALDERLPICAPPTLLLKEAFMLMEGTRTLRVAGLEPGRYTLKIDGKEIEEADDTMWAKGETLITGAEFDQVEELRSVINRKNLLYFYRWRPQNETYLFGFRKHEQGNNAVEIPLFDPLVDDEEKAIAKLKKPISHVYELSLESEVAK